MSDMQESLELAARVISEATDAGQVPDIKIVAMAILPTFEDVLRKSLALGIKRLPEQLAEDLAFTPRDKQILDIASLFVYTPPADKETA